MQCPVCHNEVGSQATFCNHCGASIASAAPAAAPPEGFAPVPGYTPTPGYPPPPQQGYSQPGGYAQQPGYPPQAGYQPPPQYPPAGYAAPSQYPPRPAGAPADGLSENAAAAIAYITFIPAVLFLLIEPYNKVPLVRFHSFQSIGLAIVAFVLQIALTVLTTALVFIPGLAVFGFIFSMLHLVLFVGFFALWLMAILKASKGEWYMLPFIGKYADAQARK